MSHSRFLLIGLLLSALPDPLHLAQEYQQTHSTAEVKEVAFDRVAWGRNTIRIRFQNEGASAATVAVRIRSHFTDSGSGVVWEATYPALLAPGGGGETGFDYFVRPDHGRLRVAVEVEDGARRIVHSETRDFEFEAPYRGEYLLQLYRVAREGIAWDTRVLPGFKIRESESFIFYYLPGSEAEEAIERLVPQREKILRRLSREMVVKLPWKAIVFFYSDAEVARRLTGHRGDGWAYGRTIVEIYGTRRRIDPSHEIVHLLMSRIGSPPALLAEGLATARERDFDNAGRHRADVESWCRAFLREGALIPLSDLMETPSLGEDLTRPRIAYPESACFVRYLLDTYGWETFRRAYAELVNVPGPEARERNLARFERVFGMSLREAEVAWKQRLVRFRGGGVPPDVVRRVVKEETVPYLVARGRQRLTTGSAAEAEEILRGAVEMDPSDLEAHFWLAQAYHLRKNYASALAEYRSTVRLGDRTTAMEVAWSRVWSGHILDLLGRREEALEQYKMAEALQDTTEVQLEGRLTSSLEAAREGLSRARRPPEGQGGVAPSTLGH